MLFVCSNCRDGTYYEAEELETSRDVEPHGEVTHWKECPLCSTRDGLIALNGDGLDRLLMTARKGTDPYRCWAAEVLYDIASDQVMV